MKYRLKPINAIQWTGDNLEEILIFSEKIIGDVVDRKETEEFVKEWLSLGDYLIVGDGCKPYYMMEGALFDRKFEPIEEPVPQKQEAAIDNLELPL